MKETILYPEDPTLGPNNPPERDIGLLNNMGVHVDHLDDLAAGKPFGAEKIEIIIPKGRT